MALWHGVVPLQVEEMDSPTQMMHVLDGLLRKKGLVRPGDMVVIVAGSPPGTVGSTNLIRVHRLGEEDHI